MTRFSPPSDLQDEILGILAGQPNPIPTSTVMAGLGFRRPTASQRVVVSKSLRRLAERGIVDVRHTELCRPGKGNLWSIAK